jgi:hypothetical protein
MPPRQAWQYIQTNGLLSYWGMQPRRPSPPLRGGYSSTTPRYAYSTRSYSSPRYGYRPSSNGLMMWGSGMPNRIQYAPSPSYSTNRYYRSVPSYQSPQPAPHPRSSSPAPSVRIPVDEPSPAPQIVNNEPPAPTPSTPPTPKTSTPAPAAAKPASDLPYGTPVAGRPNMVNSPYAGKTQLVDVSGMGPGQTVKCPYTGKLFKVPVAQQATSNTESRLESSKLADPKPEEKKP